MKSIRGRLLVLLLTGLAVILILGGAAVYWIEQSSLTRQFDAGLKARAQTLASLVKREPQNLVFESGDAPAATIAETYFELRTAAGELLKRSANLDATGLPTRYFQESEVVQANIALPNVKSARAIWMAFRPRIDPDDWQGVDVNKVDQEVLIVAAAMDRSPIDRALAALLTALLIVGGLVAVTAGVLVSVGVRWGLAPLHHLGRQLAGVNSPAMSGPIDAAGAPRELQPMYAELNAMLARLDQTFQRERTFADAAAHELRTPLAELRSMAEVALRWPDAERAQHTIRETLSIGMEMERLVESLLRFSRAQGDSMKAAGVDVPLASVVGECLARTNGTIHEKQLQLAVQIEDQQVIHAPREAVEIIVRNVIENAVNYTPARGQIAVRGSDGNGTVFSVENGPVGIRQADLPRMFEPFWRLDDARKDRCHAGLGLAVVQHTARAIGLRVDATLAGDRLRMSLHAVS